MKSWYPIPQTFPISAQVDVPHIVDAARGVKRAWVPVLIKPHTTVKGFTTREACQDACNQIMGVK